MSNQYTYSVPFTEEELYNDYFNGNMTQAEIAKKYKTTQKVVFLAMKKMGLVARKAYKRDQLKEKNSNWKGGRILNGIKPPKGRAELGNGYVYILNPDHPRADARGYVAEHVAVAIREAGRMTQPGEVVHHIDLNKRNNTPSNLEICSRKLHAEYHNQLELIAVQLIKAGKIRFVKGVGYETIDLY